MITNNSLDRKRAKEENRTIKKKKLKKTQKDGKRKEEC